MIPTGLMSCRRDLQYDRTNISRYLGKQNCKELEGSTISTNESQVAAWGSLEDDGSDGSSEVIIRRTRTPDHVICWKGAYSCSGNDAQIVSKLTSLIQL